MFSPAAKSYLSSNRRDLTGGEVSSNSPSTPLRDEPSSTGWEHLIRPATGTPAPWSSRLSLLSRGNTGQIQPVHAGEFPHVVRRAQASLMQKNAGGNFAVAGGMDKGTSLSWIICGNQLFIWNYLPTSVSKNFVVLEIPSSVLVNNKCPSQDNIFNSWKVCFIKWHFSTMKNKKEFEQFHSVGIILSNLQAQSLVYWAGIHAQDTVAPVVSFPSSVDSISSGSSYYGGNMDTKGYEAQIGDVNMSNDDCFVSLIVSEIPGTPHECFGIACQSTGELWRFRFTTSKIYRERISQNALSSNITSNHLNKVYARSLAWRLEDNVTREPVRQFFVLTDHEIQCWDVKIAADYPLSKLWTHEIVASDGDLGIKKDLAGQKHIWLLDMQVDVRGRELTILVATLCKDRVSSSSYTQYSLLTMQYKPGSTHLEAGGFTNGRVLEKKTPLQVVIPKARVEEEESLFSMRLRIGGKPSGSAVILSGDGTATVTNYWRGSTRLYQFDLPWDAGKVLDASVFSSSQDCEEGAWVVLTEKAGVWAIPEKAILLGGVEPPERSLSRKGSSNEGAAEEEKKSLAFGGNNFPRRASSEAWGAGERQRSALSAIAKQSAQDEEAEALIVRLFNDFCVSNQVEVAVDKLRLKGAFEKEGETNIFARVSKSIVDTLAKHWTMTRGPELVRHAVISSLLIDKQQKHKKYLHFLALSKCHEELASRQKLALLIIMEHGEKLSAMNQLRELQNTLSQKRPIEVGLPGLHTRSQVIGPSWKLIQLVGENARRDNVLLMDRDNEEVFYSKVSEVEELFSFLYDKLPYIISIDQPFQLQFQQVYELCSTIISLIQAAMLFRGEHQTWYPSPEGLTPWNCQSIVRAGLWSVGSSILLLFKESTVIDPFIKVDLSAQLEVLTEILLEAYSGAIMAKQERGEDSKGLKEEYFRRRNELLSSIYLETKRVAEAKYQESHKGVNDLQVKESILREVSSSLLAIAKRHEDYQILWQICVDLNDTLLLRRLMHDSQGPIGGFSDYVFKQLIKNGRNSKLLRLGEEFQEELACFLKDHPDLLWLHELFLNQFSSASETLHALALSQDDRSDSLKEEVSASPRISKAIALKARKRLLLLSKIAGMAGNISGFDSRMKRIEAHLRILKLQEQITGYCCASQEQKEISELLLPQELIDMCLKIKAREPVLLAFEVFAWSTSSFRISNKSLLKACWRNAANQDDWTALSELSLTEGWSDEVRMERLQETVLYESARRCYGPEAVIYDDPGFEVVLPLQQEDDGVSGPHDGVSSVEGVLMQHPSFPEAGKLMLTAIMLGKFGTTSLFSSGWV